MPRTMVELMAAGVEEESARELLELFDLADRWAIWRAGQCDFTDDELSQEEKDLYAQLEKLHDLAPQHEEGMLKADSISTISELVEHAHQTAKRKGFYDPPSSFGEMIALVHTELSEALEAFRAPGHKLNEIWFTDAADQDDNRISKPEGVPIELADTIIRIADMCAHFKIDLAQAIRMKSAFNEKRPHRHGR